MTGAGGATSWGGDGGSGVGRTAVAGGTAVGGGTSGSVATASVTEGLVGGTSGVCGIAAIARASCPLRRLRGRGRLPCRGNHELRDPGRVGFCRQFGLFLLLTCEGSDVPREPVDWSWWNLRVCSSALAFSPARQATSAPPAKTQSQNSKGHL